MDHRDGLNVEEHTLTPSVLTLDRPADWKTMETFAETGAWPTDVSRSMRRGRIAWSVPKSISMPVTSGSTP